MDYTNAIHIIPAPSTGGDTAIWATEEDYRQWNPSWRAGSEQPPPGKKAHDDSDGGGGSSATRKSRSIGKLFLNTKLCCNFRAGTCPYATNCKFAHGMEELRYRKPRAARTTGVPPYYTMNVAGTLPGPPPVETLPTPTLPRLFGRQTARRPGAWNPVALGLPSAEVLNMDGYGGGFYSPDEWESSSK